MTITTNLYHLNILNIFCLKNSNYSKLNPSKTFKGYIEKHKDELKDVLLYLNTYANDFNESTTIHEKLYRIKYDLLERPVCMVCGCYVNFNSFSKGYAKHCSKKCSCDDTISKEKYKHTIHEKHILKNPLEHLDLNNISEINDNGVLLLLLTKRNENKINWARIYSNKWKEIHIHYIQYILNRFNSPEDGIEENLYRIKHLLIVKPVCKVCGNPVKFVNFKKGYNNTCSHSCKSLYGPTQEKLKQTCLEKYEVDCVLKSDTIRKKCKETLDKHFKSNFFNKGPLNSPSVYSSNGEKKIFDLLKPIYLDIEQYYRDERYKNNHNGYLWECDFYIKSLDVFIEYQGFATHGDHPYNKFNEEDKLKVLELKQLAKTLNLKNNTDSCFYDSCILIWTKQDVYKRYIAKKNKLKYIEIFENYKDITLELLLNKINAVL